MQDMGETKSATLPQPDSWRLAGLSTECCMAVSQLQPGMRYAFRMHAISSQGASPWSKHTVEATAPGAPLQPEAPVCEEAAASWLRLSWREPRCQGSPVSRYLLQLRLTNAAIDGANQAATLANAEGLGAGPEDEDRSGGANAGEEGEWQQVYDGRRTSYMLQGLEPDVEFCFRVGAVNAIGPSPWSPAASFRTAAAAPSVPLHLQLTGTTCITLMQ